MDALVWLLLPLLAGIGSSVWAWFTGQRKSPPAPPRWLAGPQPVRPARRPPHLAHAVRGRPSRAGADPVRLNRPTPRSGKDIPP
jgi:hypothetical protein